MINNTSCWYCSTVYPKDMPQCPQCKKPNANEDLKAALRELYPAIGTENDHRGVLVKKEDKDDMVS